MRGKLKLIASGRCFFPAGAFFWSTKDQAMIAGQAGYEGLEFLPTWRVVWEVFRYGKLLAPEKMVSSFHRDWRFDRVMEARLKQKPWWFYQFKHGSDWLFPFSDTCAWALEKLQKRYQVPISTIWAQDKKLFSPIMVEIYGRFQGFDDQGLLGWLRSDPQSHGLVLDTVKMDFWLKDFGLLGQKRAVLKKLLPHVFEVHYRFHYRWKHDPSQNMKLIVGLGYQGKVVVELGWPDIQEPIVGWKKDFSHFLKTHRRIVKFLKSL
jgi:uncharacterized protein YlxP (DUF503 family)